MKYTVNISETLEQDVIIEAINESEAIGKAKQMYYNCEVILSADNFEKVYFNIKEKNK